MESHRRNRQQPISWKGIDRSIETALESDSFSPRLLGFLLGMVGSGFLGFYYMIDYYKRTWLQLLAEMQILEGEMHQVSDGGVFFPSLLD
jgi:hypothetical protein